MTKVFRNAGSVMVTRATWGGSQNFLGARWVERVVDNSPVPLRERVALRLLSLSPHYFYDRDIRSEAARNRRSRQILADTLIAPHLTQGAHVLDYGCGPGYLAYSVAGKAAHVTAVDVSRGVLACAKALNARPNITYQTPGDLRGWTGQVDVAYSIAVVQHLRTDLVREVLGTLADKICPRGTLLLHFAVPDEAGWRTEAQWLSDPSRGNQAKLRYGLNCFGRSAGEMADLVADSGFGDISVRALTGTITLPDDDIGTQHWLIARRQSASSRQ